MMCLALNLGLVGPRNRAFTLTEVALSLAVAAFAFGGVISGYVMSAYEAEWSAYSLAAHSLAMQGVEQARAAKWDPQAWPPIDELGVTNYTQVSPLDIPVAGGNPVWATNYIRVSSALTAPPLRQLRADCVWAMNRAGFTSGGPFTNTVVTLRAPDQ